MKIKLKDTNGLTLKTKDKLCNEDIQIVLDEKIGIITITTNKMGGGTPVPNSGYVENIYFNTSLSVEEVISIIDTLTFFSTGGGESMWLCVIDSAAANGICIAHEINIDGTPFYAIGILQNNNNIPLVWSSIAYSGQENINLGWQEGFNGVVEFNMENQLEVIAPQFGFTPENDKVSELLSTTPFTKKGIELSGEYDGTPISITENTTLDMKTLINEKKIPLSINISCTMPPTIKNLLDLTKSSKYMFNGMQELNINKYLSYSDTENVTDMSYMFNNCSKLNEVLMLDTSNAINTSGMFYNCTSLKNIPTFDTSKVTDMSYMFYKTALQEMPLLDTSNVTNMSNMLYDCNFTTMPLLNTSKVTDMSSMFKYCTNLTEVPLLDTSNATNMSDMFFNCTFTTIPLLNTSKVADMSRMFYFCSRLTDVPLLDTSSVTNMSEMFDSCYKLTTIPKFNTSKVTNMSSMFNMRFIYIESPALTTIPLLNTSKVTDMSYMFNGCINLTEVPLLDTSNVTNMTYMFKDCTSLTTVPKFNTNCATSMYGMFKNCTNLTAIPKLNCDKAILKGPYTGLREICMGCSSLTTIDMYNMRAGFDLSDCTLLSQSELVKVFNNLATVESTTILTLGSTLLAKLTEEDMAIAINKGWTLA